MDPKRSGWLLAAVLPLVGCGMTDSPTKETIIPVVTPDLTLEVVSGDRQSQRVERTLAEPLVVKVRDHAGRPWQGQSVRFEVLSGDAILNGGDVVATSADGLASVGVQLGSQPSSVQVPAKLQIASFDEGKHQYVFTETATAIPPPRLLIVDDLFNGQRGTVGTTLASPLAVVARDEDGNGVPGQTIRFTIVSGGPSVQVEPELVTDCDGIASATLYLGTTAGEIRVRATWLPDPDGDPNRNVTFAATADPDLPAVLSFVSGHLDGENVACAGENEEFPAPLVARLTDQYGNRIPGQNILVQPAPDLALIGSAPGTPLDLPTDASGEVSLRLVVGAIADGYSRGTWVSAVTLLAGGAFGPTAYAALNYTRHRYLEMAEGSQTWNYGMSGLYTPPTLFFMYLDYPVLLWARGKCWAPLANVPVEGTGSVKYSLTADFCPDTVDPWPADEPLWDSNTGSNGYFAMTVRAAVYTMTMKTVATRTTFVAHSAEGDTNPVVFYAGPGVCQ